MLTKLMSMDPRAEFAMHLSEHLITAGECEEMNKFGHYKIRNLTPIEIARHACDTADAVFLQFQQREWLKNLEEK